MVVGQLKTDDLTIGLSLPTKLYAKDTKYILINLVLKAIKNKNFHSHTFMIESLTDHMNFENTGKKISTSFKIGSFWKK